MFEDESNVKGELTWLHISDWHQGDTDFDRRFVAKRLMDDIRERISISPELAKIDFIIFSGDVTYAGLASEYEDAVKYLFEPLMECTDLYDNGWSRLIVVPGNHDMDRNKARQIPDSLVSPMLTSKDSMKRREAVTSCLEDEDKREVLFSQFENFKEFVVNKVRGNTRELQLNPEYYQTRKIRVGGKSIGVAGFNSAWLSDRNQDSSGWKNDYGHLVIGEPPTRAALDRISDANIRIAVMHHPLTWLTDFDRDFIEECFYGECHFVLHGHQHLPRVHVIASTLGDTVNIPAGTLYNRRHPTHPRYTNSYNFVHLDFSGARGTVYLRRWDDLKKKGWVKDEAYTPKGQFQFVLPKIVESQDDVYLKQVSSLAGQMGQRFCKSHSVNISHRFESLNGVPVIRQEVHQRLRLAPGAAQPFMEDIILSANDRMTNLGRRTGMSRPYESMFFRLNGRSVSALQEGAGKVSYVVDINEKEVTIEYKYVLYMNTDDYFLLLLKRFTGKLSLIVEKESQFDYEIIKLGDIPVKEARTPHADEFEVSDLCRPDQGFVIQWYPKQP